MAGYSGKSVVQKLGIKPGFRIFTAGAPAAYRAIIGELPADVTIVTRLKAPLDMGHEFAAEAAGAGFGANPPPSDRLARAGARGLRKHPPFPPSPRIVCVALPAW